MCRLLDLIHLPFVNSSLYDFRHLLTIHTELFSLNFAELLWDEVVPNIFPEISRVSEEEFLVAPHRIKFRGLIAFDGQEFAPRVHLVVVH